ncbi:MAG TPA: BatD family protein [Hyphomicrobiales bacterium]|nr:BatD family protein [Hyphomicrobiales bacterium]
MVNAPSLPPPAYGVSHILLLKVCVLLLGLLLGMSARAQGLSAFVDRTDVSINDVITLTLRIDSNLGAARPQFSGLNREFEQVGGISSRSTYTNNNGNIQSWTEYSIMLRPLTTGVLTIPAFRVNGEVSNSIQVKVGEARQDVADEDSDIFLRSTVSKDSVYVQEQLLYTIKIYWSISFDQGAQLTSPQVADAVVQQLGTDSNHQEVVNGINFNVTERKFVIFPQSSGELVIPPVYFSASVGRRGSFNSFFRNSRAPIREINLVSETHNIAIKPQPASFPAGATWLPAKQLALEETWSGNLDALSVGDAVTHNVILNAEGLSSSLLPGVTYANQGGLRFYPDQPVREDNADSQGMHGKRTDGTAIVASASGDFTLPEVRLPWWNTETDRLETATLPARTINVQPSAANDVLPGVFSDQNGVSANGAPTVAAPASSGTSLLWVVATALFAAAWAFTTFLWLRSRQQLVYAETLGTAPMPHLPERRSATGNDDPDAQAALQLLKLACQKNDLRAVRTALIKWTRASGHDNSVQTLEAVQQYWNDPTLSTQLKALDAALYGGGERVECQPIFEQAARLHKDGQHSVDTDKYQLPPLYKQ